MTRNLLFITTDQQRWDSLPCYGLDFMQTPALDRLAAEGMVFENCSVASPVCVSCRSAMLSGMYPSASGGRCPPELVSTWPSLLGATGRRTAGIGKMHFSPWDSLGGFDERIIAEDKRHVYLPDDHVHFLKAHGLDRPHPVTLPQYFESLGAPITPRPKKFHVDGFTGDQAALWLERHGAEPFAAWVSFAGPHDPYDPPEEMADLYYDAPIPEPYGSAEELETKPSAQARVRDKRKSSMHRLDLSQATPEQYRRWRAHYYANITLIDEGIGKMLQALAAVGTLDETLIVFTSDHGDALGDHATVLKSFFYDCMVHVPLLIRGPGVPAGQRSPALVSTLDLVPLFYRACDAELPGSLQGEDLTPLFADPTGSIRDVVFSEIQGRVMTLTKEHKYVHYVDGSAELYDVVADPHELTNLAGDPDRREIEHHLRGLIVEHDLRCQAQRARIGRGSQYRVRAKLEAEYRDFIAAGGRPEDAPTPSF